jgi:hypothetical protein
LRPQAANSFTGAVLVRTGKNAPRANRGQHTRWLHLVAFQQQGI